MAVFTRVSPEQLQTLLESYFDAPEVTEFQGIAAGIENTNYFVSVTSGGEETRWVLTIFEMVTAEELPVFIDLMQGLAQQGFPAPAPHLMLDGSSLAYIEGKPCVLVPRIAGGHLDTPTRDQCAIAGDLLGAMHLASRSAPGRREVVRTVGWMQSHRDDLAPHIKQDELALLNAEIEHFQQQADIWAQCPNGWIHGDLFVDNVMFDGDKVSGVIDFYHACHDCWLFDLAVACNDWCCDAEGNYDQEKLRAFVEAYDNKRPLTDLEKSQWSGALRVGALRFWISRLISQYGKGYQHEAERGNTLKNPDEMKAKLLSAHKIAAL
ncbi:homoserine kinase [Hahella sp. HN01]|uniref:homoserine kinase n=1 Tax=Hahella sp. HN01 TaxID=2847262 RepID=UPI001C1EA73F|nr:homoserine kinase [Hahella sp. HN01]MBU6952674.1 homoserine kinase [Hahella sp. HN01]